MATPMMLISNQYTVSLYINFSKPCIAAGLKHNLHSLSIHSIFTGYQFYHVDIQLKYTLNATATSCHKCTEVTKQMLTYTGAQIQWLPSKCARSAEQQRRRGDVQLI